MAVARRIHGMLCLLASSVAVMGDDAAATAPVTTWGFQDQTAVVGRLFELRLPGIENDSTLAVSIVIALTVCGHFRTAF